MERLLAIDPSLTCSGWALFSVGDKKLLSVGKIRSMGTSFPLAHRLKDIQKKITALYKDIQISGRDIVICEAPTTMKDPNAAIKVEQVRSIFEAEARMNGAEVPGRLNPRTVQREVLGLMGRQMDRKGVKQTACGVAYLLFGKTFHSFGLISDESELKKHQDIVDAVLVGHTALSRIQSSRVAAIPLATLFLEKKNRACG